MVSKIPEHIYNLLCEAVEEKCGIKIHGPDSIGGITLYIDCPRDYDYIIIHINKDDIVIDTMVCGE